MYSFLGSNAILDSRVRQVCAVVMSWCFKGRSVSSSEVVSVGAGSGRDFLRD